MQASSCIAASSRCAAAKGAGLQRGEQWRVPRRDTDLAAGRRREHHRGGTRVDLALGADDIDMNGVGHRGLR
jgi:hypothetical protein